MGFFFIIFPFLIFITVAAQTLRLIEIVQRKEYRFDRLRDFFKTREGQRFLFCPTFFMYGALILLFSLLSLYPGIFSSFFVTLIFYILTALTVFIRIFRRTLPHPHGTYKALALFFLVFGSEAYLFAPLAFSFNVFFIKSFRVLSSTIGIFLPLPFFINLLLPFIFIFWLILLQIATFIVKGFIFRAARRKIQSFPRLIVIGITGSFGKSTTKHFLASILSKQYKVLKTEGNVNSEIGVAKTILKNLKPEHEIFIVEMGAYRIGEIAAICRMVQPKIGILTAVSPQHLALFGSLDNIQQAKYELIKALPADGLAIFNGDNALCHELFAKTPIPKTLYAVKPENFRGASFFATDIENEYDSSTFTLHAENESREFTLPVPGAHNISNYLAAVAVADFLGMTLSQIRNASGDIRLPSKILSILPGIHGATVIDDTYSANPDGVLSALEYLAEYGKRRKILVMRSMIELGEKTEEAHRKVGEVAGKILDLAIFTTPDGFEAFRQGAVSAGMRPENILQINAPKEIMGKVLKYVSEDDVILLENRIPKQIIDVLKKSR
ncbi:hypothetical protein HZA41_02770 [Candidatus Peregrinibacteria bacterium]|nr:hypothetical protein [Candidatus Peregrinibacteria bacterium]